MCSVMIAIEYSYKLDTKNDFNLWCELGRFLHRQSHISSLTTDIAAAVAESFPTDSVQRIFWEQQNKYNSVEHRQMKWHPYMIRFALNLKYASTTAYRAVQQSGVIALPSERTLRDYTHWVAIKDGPQSEVFIAYKR